MSGVLVIAACAVLVVLFIWLPFWALRRRAVDPISERAAQLRAEGMGRADAGSQALREELEKRD